jgi:hypothetical protein
MLFSMTCRLIGSLTLLGVFTASTVRALAIDDDALERFNGEVEHFKRDHILDERDLALADSHGVNLTESTLKRRDKGDGKPASSTSTSSQHEILSVLKLLT